MSSDEASLRRLLGEAHERYLVALDDWETRADPDKPKRRLEDNWSPDDADATDPIYDYGEFAGRGFSDWEAEWMRHYYRRRGNPGRGRTKDLPVEPLHIVYFLVRVWWLTNINLRGFNPIYPREYGDGPRSAPQLFNPAGRLFLLIAQEMDARYTADVCANIRDTLKRRKRKRSTRPE